MERGGQQQQRARALLPGHAQPGHHDLNGRDDARERLEEEEGQ